MRGYYSEKQRRITGVAEFRKADGSLVRCTSVSVRPGEPSSCFSDTQDVGDVEALVRVVESPRQPLAA